MNTFFTFLWNSFKNKRTRHYVTFIRGLITLKNYISIFWYKINWYKKWIKGTKFNQTKESYKAIHNKIRINEYLSNTDNHSHEKTLIRTLGLHALFKINYQPDLVTITIFSGMHPEDVLWDENTNFRFVVATPVVYWYRSK